MKFALAFALLSLVLYPIRALADFKDMGEAATKWPGIRYQIYSVVRYSPNELLIGVRLVATPQAPSTGTLIGIPVPIPPNATKEDIGVGKYATLPISLMSSTMIDDATQKSYSPIKGIPPPGRVFYQSEIVDNLLPGHADVLSVQFVVPPPPPPPAPGQPPVKQTLSFLFTNAKEPIKNIPIPPLDPASK